MSKTIAAIYKGNDEHRYSYYTTDHDWIYERMMEITGNDHEISADAASWCELASVGERYTFREGWIDIKEA